jgi:hypothetical protein
VKKIFRVSIKIIAGLVLGILVLVTSLVLAFILIPRFEVGTDQLSSLTQRFLPSNLAVQFSNAHFVLEKNSIFEKDIHLELENLCVNYEKTAVRSCFQHIEAGARISYHWLPKLERIFPLRLLHGSVAVDLPAFPHKAENRKNRSFSLVNFLRKNILPKWDISGSRIELDPIRVVSEKFDYESKLILETTDDTQKLDSLLHIGLSEVRDVKTSTSHGHADFNVHWPLASADKDWRITLQALAIIDAKRSLDLHLLSYLRTEKDFDFDIQSMTRGISSVREASVKGHLRDDEVNGVISAKLGGWETQIQALNFVGCGFAFNLKNKNGSFQCGPQTVLLALKERPVLRDIQLLRLQPTFELRIKDFNYQNGVKANWDLDFNLNHLGFAYVNLQASGGVNQQSRTHWLWDIKEHTGLQITSFQKLVRLLQPTPFSVPAPLNNLDGRMDFNSEGSFNQDGGRLPFSFQPELSSADQHVLLTTTGALEIQHDERGYVPALDAKVLINQANLSLPRLEMSKTPKVLMDKRFVANLPKPSASLSKQALSSPLLPAGAPSKFHYHVEVVTNSPTAIQIASNLTKAPVPIGGTYTIDNSSPQATHGSLVLGRTPLDLLHRDWYLETMNLQLAGGDRNTISGRISANSVDYDVDIIVSGPMKHPLLHFESNPPLPEEQILAVILFGKPMDTLNADQKDSVGNASSAIADAALSISSLYLLADTPIEGIGYDPERQMVTARVGLGKGTSLELGSANEQLSSVGLHRRLGREWILSSYVERDQATQDENVSARIEWVKKF